MMLFAVILFIAGCIVSSVEDSEARAEARERKLQNELIRLSKEQREMREEQERRDQVIAPRGTKITRRRIAQDKEGNVLAEEVTEEMV